MPNFFFLLKPNNRFTGTFSWINPYRRPFFLIKVVRQSVRGFIRNMSWKRHRLARRRIIAESRPMYAELPVCRARAWALCYASSLPPGATSDTADSVTFAASDRARRLGLRLREHHPGQRARPALLHLRDKENSPAPQVSGSLTRRGSGRSPMPEAATAERPRKGRALLRAWQERRAVV